MVVFHKDREQFTLTTSRLQHRLREQTRRRLAAIANYEKRLAQARADLAHKTAAITIFEASGDVEEIPPYFDIHRCFKRGEAIALCEEALANGPLNTRQLALRVMAAKGLDTGDKVLATAVASRLIHALRQQCRRGLIDGDRAVLAHGCGLCQRKRGDVLDKPECTTGARAFALVMPRLSRFFIYMNLKE